MKRAIQSATMHYPLDVIDIESMRTYAHMRRERERDTGDVTAEMRRSLAFASRV